MSNFRRIRMRDIIVILAAGLLLMPAVFFAERNLLLAAFVVIFVFSMIAIFCRKISVIAGSIIAGGLLAAAAGRMAGNPVNASMLGVFILLGLLFELVVVVTKENGMGIIFAGGISGAILPFLAYMLMGLGIRKNLEVLLLTGMDYLIIGVCSALAALLIWYCVRNKRGVLMFVHAR